mmetsp:Transcript_6490/g.13907  ORF Transcript_6490/g.13907 Transcript_6490/m.13907 type:complete len:100 (+) Transcript_6490:176-475(+)
MAIICGEGAAGGRFFRCVEAQGSIDWSWSRDSDGHLACSPFATLTWTRIPRLDEISCRQLSSSASLRAAGARWQQSEGEVLLGGAFFDASRPRAPLTGV